MTNASAMRGRSVTRSSVSASPKISSSRSVEALVKGSTTIERVDANGLASSRAGPVDAVRKEKPRNAAGQEDAAGRDYGSAEEEGGGHSLERQALADSGRSYLNDPELKRLGDVLETLGAKRADLKVDLAGQVGARCLIDADGAGWSILLQPRGDVDAVAEQVAVLLDDDIAEVQSHPDLDGVALRQGSLQACRFRRATLLLRGPLPRRWRARR